MLDKPRILIVENELVVALDVKACLNDIGCDVAGIATTGEDAVRYAFDRGPDLILMDICLDGDMDGISAAGMIKRRLDMPIIYMTANADNATVERARETAPHGYLNKPVSKRDLFTSIDSVIYRHNMEKRLRESEERYRALVDQVPGAVYEIDEHGLITFVSAAIEDMTGFSPSEMRGRHFSEFFHHDDLPAVFESIAKMRARISEENQYRILKKTGGYAWVRTSNRPVFNERSFCGARGVMVDISGIKRAEMEVSMLAAILASSPDAIYGKDRDGTIISWNGAAERLFGIPAAEAVGTPFSRMASFSSSDAPPVVTPILDSSGAFMGELYIVRADNR